MCIMSIKVIILRTLYVIIDHKSEYERYVTLKRLPTDMRCLYTQIYVYMYRGRGV